MWGEGCPTRGTAADAEAQGRCAVRALRSPKSPAHWPGAGRPGPDSRTHNSTHPEPQPSQATSRRAQGGGPPGWGCQTPAMLWDLVLSLPSSRPPPLALRLLGAVSAIPCQTGFPSLQTIPRSLHQASGAHSGAVASGRDSSLLSSTVLGDVDACLLRSSYAAQSLGQPQVLSAFSPEGP